MKIVDDIFVTDEVINGTVNVNQTEIEFKCLFQPDELEYVRINGGDAWLEFQAKRFLLNSDFFGQLLFKLKFELRKSIMNKIKEKMEDKNKENGI